MKKLALLMVIVLVVLGCSSAVAETKIYWSQWQTEYTDALAHLLQEYTNQHPDVVFEIDMDGNDSKYQTLLASDSLPDMIMTVGGKSTRNWLEHLEPLTGEECWEKLSDFSKEWLTFDGEGYGVPVTMLSYGFIYNVDLFEQAGIENTPRTWSELLEVVDKLEAAGITPFSTMFGDTWWMGHFATEMVWDAIRAHDETPWETYLQQLDDGEIDFHAIGKYWDRFFDALDLMNAHDVYSDEDALSGSWDRAIADLATGNAAMLYMGEFILPDLYRANPDANVDVFGTLFSDDPADYRLSVDINCVWNVTNGPNKDICTDVLNWMCTDETALSILNNEFGIISPYTDGVYTKNTPIGLTTVEALKNNETSNWIFNNYSRAQMEGIYPDVQTYLLGELSREEALDYMYALFADLA